MLYECRYTFFGIISVLFLYTYIHISEYNDYTYTYPTDLSVFSGTSDNGHSEEWTTSLQWTNYSPPAYILSIHFSTSEEGTTSEQWTKCSSPNCPLFGGSTVNTFYSLFVFLYVCPTTKLTTNISFSAIISFQLAPHNHYRSLTLYLCPLSLVGGIYTVIRSKAGVTTSELGDQYCMIGT